MTGPVDRGHGTSPGTIGAAPVAGDTTPAGIEARIARLLSLGTRAAIALLGIGCLLLLVDGRSPLEPRWPALDLRVLPADLLGLRAEGFLWLGLLVTLATPLLRVAAATLGFARAGERRMVALGAGVLAVIALAVAAGTIGS